MLDFGGRSRELRSAKKGRGNEEQQSLSPMVKVGVHSAWLARVCGRTKPVEERAHESRRLVTNLRQVPHT